MLVNKTKIDENGRINFINSTFKGENFKKLDKKWHEENVLKISDFM